MTHSIPAPLGRAFALSLALHAGAFLWGAYLAALLPSTVRPAPPPLNVRLAETPAIREPQPELRMPKDNPPPARPAAERIREPAKKTLAEPARKAVTAPAQRLTRPPPAEAPATASPGGVQVLTGEASRRAGEQIARELFYPPDAIRRGLEGEALVLLFLDAAGDAIAARIETSSGHPILDDAAVRAARTLRSLPASAPREALVPVRFRLR